MVKQQVIDAIEVMRMDYSIKADNMFRKLGRDVVIGNVQNASHDILTVTRYESKVDVLEELLNNLKELQ